jgi:hypothetical protein
MHYKDEERAVHEPRTQAPEMGSMRDLANADSLASRTSGILHDLIVGLPDELILDEHDLKAKTGFTPNKTHVLLRHSFWMEYDRAVRVSETAKMIAKAIFSQIVLDETNFVKMIRDQRVLAYILIPVKSYKVLTEGYHAYAGERLMEILSLPIQDVEGKLDFKVIDRLIKIYDKLDNRVKGAVVQRIDSRVLSQTIPAPGAGGPPLPAPRNVDEEIRQLQNQLKPQLLQATVVTEDEAEPNENS